jgi:hypothetical protein
MASEENRMSLQGFLERVVCILEKAGVSYMVCGSIASTFYSTPRTTHDIDIVVELSGPQLQRLLQYLPEEDYYVSEEAAMDALRRRSMFNVVDLESGWKLDLVVRKNRPFSEEEFRRRRQVEVVGVSLWMASPEDCVISKLEWAALGESERQLRDVRQLVEVQGETLDLGYIQHWVKELKLDGVWQRMLAMDGG